MKSKDKAHAFTNHRLVMESVSAQMEGMRLWKFVVSYSRFVTQFFILVNT